MVPRFRPVRSRLGPRDHFSLSQDTYLEPDVVIYPRASGTAGLSADNVLLVVEIADSSLRYDIGRKAALYAGFGIRELWVIDAVRLDGACVARAGGGRLSRRAGL